MLKSLTQSHSRPKYLSAGRKESRSTAVYYTWHIASIGDSRKKVGARSTSISTQVPNPLSLLRRQRGGIRVYFMKLHWHYAAGKLGSAAWLLAERKLAWFSLIKGLVKDDSQVVLRHVK